MHKIRFRMAVAMVFVTLVSVLIVGAYAIYNLQQTKATELNAYQVSLYAQFDRSIKLQVETAISLVQDLYNLQQKGTITETDAKKRAADLIRNLRFDDGNYFWIDTAEGINVVLLGRDQEGKTRLEAKDNKGTMLASINSAICLYTFI